ncbi:GGDEF domain-containing protein [Pseudochrobactrum sp. Wa41.01b-1]|uniref:GGDEF domain-containing protein n=1 Tax=Pseudochrobactrum sp. Wa41.01b-1 TaxID=2864102 RepID=UPI0021054668|nr:GGDEF domain-containing protein [Pseudochrobactrum sp. Wa41.01b-1]
MSDEAMTVMNVPALPTEMSGDDIRNPHICLTPSESEWVQLIHSLPDNLAKQLACLIEADKDRLVGVFYDRLLQNPDASPFLSQDVVHDRLQHSMRGWLRRLFVERTMDVVVFVAEQRKIGEVHARIQVPIHVVMQGARLLKNEIVCQLQSQAISLGDFAVMADYVGNAINIAIEFMSQAFVSNTKSDAQTDEAYRAFALSQDVTLEREIQRASLMEWSQSVLFSLYGNRREAVLPLLSSSDFGLWLHHKGDMIFHGSPVLENIRADMKYIDTVLLPAIAGADADQNLTELIESFKNKTGEIKFLLAELFQAAAAMETGRDPLTRTLNRRFLPSILSREVKMASQNRMELSVMMVDIDNFKRINDTYGHGGGDHILQQVAESIFTHSRASDFVFRYGGEEFLVVLIEASAKTALETAEKLRLKIAGQQFSLPDGGSQNITLSIGVSTFNGHPDFSHLIKTADQALYQAKQNGRNRTEVAIPLS